MRKVFECFKCGFAWHSPWWEPTFVGRRMAVKEHEVMHDVSLANALSWKSGGAEAERERIIKLLEQDFFHHIEFETITLRAGMEPQMIKKHGVNCLACPAIALIKGEIK